MNGGYFFREDREPEDRELEDREPEEREPEERELEERELEERELEEREAPDLFAAAFPACLAALPADRAADFAPLTTPPAAFLA